MPNSPITSGSKDVKQIPDANHFDRKKKDETPPAVFQRPFHTITVVQGGIGVFFTQGNIDPFRMHIS